MQLAGYHPHTTFYKLPHLQSNCYVFCGHCKEEKNSKFSCVSIRVQADCNGKEYVNTHTHKVVWFYCKLDDTINRRNCFLPWFIGSVLWIKELEGWSDPTTHVLLYSVLGKMAKCKLKKTKSMQVCLDIGHATQPSRCCTACWVHIVSNAKSKGDYMWLNGRNMAETDCDIF
jgi:hypothetical protein